MGNRIKAIVVVCGVCHKPFGTTAPNAKNCPGCRGIAMKIAKKKYYQTHPRKHKDPFIETGDSPLRRAICLSCTSPVEKCKGWCDKLLEEDN